MFSFEKLQTYQNQKCGVFPFTKLKVQFYQMSKSTHDYKWDISKNIILEYKNNTFKPYYLPCNFGCS